MSKDPNKCSNEDCNNDIGPDSLEFTHKGEPAGGFCDVCIGNAPAVRVLFKRGDDGQFFPIEMSGLDKPL